MAAYADVTLIKTYCTSLTISETGDLTEAELIAYAENEDKYTLNPALVKQYSLTDIQTAVTNGTSMGLFIKILSAKLGALAALKAVYSKNQQKQLKDFVDDLEQDTFDTLRQIKVGEIRL
jgi:hypothetical protein